MLNNNFLAIIFTFLASIAWLRINDYFAHRGWINSSTSRKIIHIGTGPIFVLCWLLFTDDWYSRYLAALVPLLITIQFLLIGLGIIKDQASVDAMSRTGNRNEILRGPLYYGVVFVVLTIIFWDLTPIGIIALMIMCGGDGMADIIGKRYPILRIPWSPKKSLGGSLSVIAGGWLFSFVVVSIYILMGKFNGQPPNFIPAICIIAVIGASVETLPFADIDNLTVPAAAVAAGLFLFPL